MVNSIYKNDYYKAKFIELYGQFVELLPKPVEEGYVDTKFGKTHYLAIGSKNLPVLFNFHGGNSINPHDLLPIADLSKKYRIIAPDIIGQPGKSEETRLNSKSLDYGIWASEFINHFYFNKVNCMGGSYGGGVLMHLAATNPKKINKAIFIVPTGFVRSNTIDNLRQFGPSLIRYFFNKTTKNLLSIIEPLVIDTSLITDLEIEMFRIIFRGLKLSTSMPRPIQKKELLSFIAPCMIATAEKDIMCPANEVMKFAEHRIPHVVKKICFKEKPHMVTSYKESMKYFVNEVDKFLAN